MTAAWFPRRLRVSTLFLMVGLVLMYAWADNVGLTSSVARVGRHALIGAGLALLIELRGPKPIWGMRRELLAPATILLFGGMLLAAALVVISSRTNGCSCSGSVSGLLETELWITLVFVVALADPAARVPLLAAVVGGC